MTDDLTTTAEKLIPLLSEHAAETEAAGRPAAPALRAVREAGFLNLFAPAALGGHQAGLATAVDVFERLGRGCGSTAWVAMLASGGSYLAALLGDEARADVWGDDPQAMVCGGFGPTGTAQPVPGGFTVSGRWQPLSGVQDAQWAMVAVPEHGMVLLPVADGEIEQTWQVAGMRGTGSHTLTVRDVFVPAHRVLSTSRMFAGGYAADHPGEPLYQAMPISLLSVAMLGPVLGMAQAALTTTLDRLARGKAIGGTVYRNATDSPAVRLGVADAASRLDTARLHTDRAVRDVTAAQPSGGSLPVAGRARIRMDTAATVTAVRGAIQLLLDVNGASVFASGQPLQRIWRDVEVATRHQMVASDVSREVYGRALLGIEEQITPLF
ncbi:acyl-CoA dehydrogenase family protein [Actinoplanes sp. M2I2]|uniref:acyl-CoA dehydrogenase family protein n=1 Tax=Actinoplanes sp. M2I2 TaxID=1734444 RepID=UPI002021B416|nr:acyl-CoA dehydrogenase family protein [Actinoplanes sp. M2I2]